MRFFGYFAAVFLLLPALAAVAQKNPSPALAKTVAEFPPKTFLENLCFAGNGDLLVTSYEDGVLYRVTRDEKKQVFARVPGSAAGIIAGPGGGLLVTGADPKKTPVVFLLSAAGKAAGRIPLPTGAQFPNGIVRLTPTLFLVADSYRGAIWQVNAATKKATLFLAHPLLARSDAKNPFPAVNGLRIFGETLYATNTQRRLLLRIPLGRDRKPGVPRVWLKDVNLDDFDVDPNGNLLATTHVFNGLVRITPQGTVTPVAGLAEGMAGSTSARFGPDGALYVATNGGMSLPPPGGLQPAGSCVSTCRDNGATDCARGVSNDWK